MGIERTMDALTSAGLSRRQCLLAAAGSALWPAAWAAGTQAEATLVAAWEAENQYRVGLINVNGERWTAGPSLSVPTRPHALLAEPDGTVLAVARRPGDWLLRWRPGATAQQWHWIDGDRRFNGHATASADRTQLWTTETDLETAQGRLGVRDLRSLEKTDEWATHGMDPHELLVLPQAVGGLPAGTLIVANGGIPTLPETGRSKRHLNRMDASLVALSPSSGERLGQWRLDDPFLSIRHLAWDAANATLGIALQAEHPTPEERWRAPVLAVWDGQRLTPTPEPTDLRGYGGAIAVRPGGGFLVGCPRANAVASFDTRARWSDNLPLQDACAVAASGNQWWAGGSAGVLHKPQQPGATAQLAAATTAPHWDNHWQVWPRA
jgi:hypothetical protein